MAKKLYYAKQYIKQTARNLGLTFIDTEVLSFYQPTEQEPYPMITVVLSDDTPILKFRKNGVTRRIDKDSETVSNYELEVLGAINIDTLTTAKDKAVAVLQSHNETVAANKKDFSKKRDVSLASNLYKMAAGIEKAEELIKTYNLEQRSSNLGDIEKEYLAFNVVLKTVQLNNAIQFIELHYERNKQTEEEKMDVSQEGEIEVFDLDMEE